MDSKIKLLVAIVSIRNLVAMKKATMETLMEYRPELVDYEDGAQLEKLMNQLEELEKEYEQI
jgi:hypothetical protein